MNDYLGQSKWALKSAPRLATSCPACGSTDITTRPHDGPKACDGVLCDGARYVRTPQTFWARDHTGLRCEKCLYAWAVATFDNGGAR